MVTEDKNIDKIIKEKFEDFQASPPNHLWRNIKGSVAGGSSLFLLQKFLGTPIGAGVSVVTGVTIAIIGYNVFTGDKEIESDAAVSNKEKTIAAAEKSDITVNDESTSYAFSESAETVKPDATPFSRFENRLDYKYSSNSQFIAPLIGNKSQINTSEKTQNDKLKSRDISSLPENESIAELMESEQMDLVQGNELKTVALKTAPEPSKEEKASLDNNYFIQEEAVSEKPEGSHKIQSAGDEMVKINEESTDNDLKYIKSLAFESLPFGERYTDPSFLSSTSASDSALFSMNITPIQLKDDYGKRSSLGFGLFYAPEKVYYPLRENQKSNTFEINGIYHFSNFLVQSGVGISIVEDLCDYNVDYNSFEIVGSYYDVDSLVFDSINGIPTYYTTLQNVYDSVNRNCGSNTINKYTYLRLPFIFGYQKDFKRFSYHIKGGPVLNILLKSTEPDPYMYSKNISVLEYDRLSPGRIKTYWQLNLGVGITYHLSHKLGLMIEPTANYNLSTVYERNYKTSKRPYSLGIRTGIILNF